MVRLGCALLFASTLLFGCNRSEQATAEARPTHTKAAAAAKAAEKAKALEKAKAKPEQNEHADEPRRFVVPFAWEASRDEPLSQTRAYLKEILADNHVYMEHGPKFFASFADGQKPRATVLTCADSRVHTSAFDTTPENDDFMVRNIGNQVNNALGSVEYGVEHLETPVLMILGHSGCGAVKAAMGDISTQSEAVRHELENLHVSKPKTGVSADAAWSEAVVENVHSQVAIALQHFGSRVQEGKLTVVGVVYDFRNDLGHGSGKITIVDVNGNSDASRMQAFVEAIENDAAPGASRKKDGARGKRGDVERADSGSASEAANNPLSPELKRVVDRANEMANQASAPKLRTAAPAPSPAAASGH